MPQIPKDLKNRKTLLIGTGVVLLATALTFWNWKSSHKKESSVKHKKSQREVVSDKDKDAKQSQNEENNVVETTAKVVKEFIAEEQPVTRELITEELVTKESATEELAAKASTPEVVVDQEPVAEEAVVAAKEEGKKEEKSVEISDQVVVIAVEGEQVVTESQFDESSSTKSQPSSTTTSSTDETDIRTPEHEAEMKKPIDTHMKEPEFDWTDAPVKETDASLVMVPELEEKEDFVVVKHTDDEDVEADMPQFNKMVPSSTLTASAPEFVPKAYQAQPKKSNKKFLTREQLIEQQRQHHIPRSKARCSHWPHCTNNNCKFFHPYKPCRAGDECLFGDRCMFVHPSDCAVPSRDKNSQSASSSILLN